MSKIIYQNSEGGVSIVHPTGEVPIEDLPAKLGLTDYEIVADDANIIFGTSVDESFQDEISVTVVATSFGELW